MTGFRSMVLTAALLATALEAGAQAPGRGEPPVGPLTGRVIYGPSQSGGTGYPDGAGRMVLGPPTLGSPYDRVEALPPSQRSGGWTGDDFLRRDAWQRGGRRVWGGTRMGAAPDYIEWDAAGRPIHVRPHQYPGLLTSADEVASSVPCVRGMNDGCGNGIPVVAVPQSAAYLGDPTCYMGLEGWVCTRYEIPVVEYTIPAPQNRQFVQPGVPQGRAPRGGISWGAARPGAFSATPMPYGSAGPWMGVPPGNPSPSTAPIPRISPTPGFGETAKPPVAVPPRP